MTADQANKKIILGYRVKKISKDRLDLLANVLDCTPGELLDSFIDVAYSNALQNGRIQGYLENLEKVENGKVS